MFKDVVDCNSTSRGDTLANVKCLSEPEDNTRLGDALRSKVSTFSQHGELLRRLCTQTHALVECLLLILQRVLV